MDQHTEGLNDHINKDIDTSSINERNTYGSVNPADIPMPDPAAANAKAREIYEANHPTTDEGDSSIEATQRASNPDVINLASDRREVNRAPNRANEATDPNDTGSGGIPAGGVKSGSSIQ